MDTVTLDRFRHLVPELVSISPYVESTYDIAADTLYLTLERGAEADDSELTEDDILLRYHDGRLIGVTVMNASKRTRSAV